MSFLSNKIIKTMGFKSVGEDVRLSKKASFYNCGNISIGSHVRIDDFCLLSAGVGGIEICNHIHIGAYTSLIGAGKIVLKNYSNISSRVSIYSSNDDYGGAYMTGPMVNGNLTNFDTRDVVVEEHVIVGAGSVVMPGVILSRGVAIGALSFVKKTCDAYGIYAGQPAQFVKKRLGLFETLDINI